MSAVEFIPALRFHFLTGIYDTVFRMTMPENKFRNDLAERILNRNGKSVLEFGVGTASNAIRVNQKDPSVKVTGIDVDNRILTKAHNKVKASNSAVTLLLYDGKKLPFENNSFDVVFSSLVFHHLIPTDKVNAFLEINRVLKPKGKFVYADWGKPVGLYSKIAFGFLGLFDGPLNTRDHRTGVYHQQIENSGFDPITLVKRYQTVYGTLELAETTKSESI